MDSKNRLNPAMKMVLKKEMDFNRIKHLKPFIFFILPDMPMIPAKFTMPKLGRYSWMYLMIFFIGENKDYDKKTMVDAFIKEMERCLDEKIPDERMDPNKFLELIELYEQVNLAKPLKSSMSTKVHSKDFKYLKVILQGLKKWEGQWAYVLICIDILTKWVTYILFIKSGFCEGKDKKDVWFRRDRLVYTGIALVEVSINSIPHYFNKLVSIELLTNDFWCATQKLKEEIIRELSEKDLDDKYNFPIHKEIYDMLVSEDDIDLGTKGELVYFIKELSEIYN